MFLELAIRHGVFKIMSMLSQPSPNLLISGPQFGHTIQEAIASRCRNSTQPIKVDV